MPCREVTRISLREEFVQLAMQAGSNRRELCRRFGVSAKTGYKWLVRCAGEGSGVRSASSPLSPKQTIARIHVTVNGGYPKLRCAEKYESAGYRHNCH